MAASNPFSSLFIKQKKTSSEISIKDVLEEIFGFTINPDNVLKGKLFLEEVKNVHQQTELDVNLLHYALFERLFMCNDKALLEQFQSDGHSHETKVINYLYVCYKKLLDIKLQLNETDFNKIENEIIQNVSTAFQPDIYTGQDISGDIRKLLIDNEECALSFFKRSISTLLSEENGKLKSCFLIIKI